MSTTHFDCRIAIDNIDMLTQHVKVNTYRWWEIDDHKRDSETWINKILLWKSKSYTIHIRLRVLFDKVPSKSKQFPFRTSWFSIDYLLVISSIKSNWPRAMFYYLCASFFLQVFIDSVEQSQSVDAMTTSGLSSVTTQFSNKKKKRNRKN